MPHEKPANMTQSKTRFLAGQRGKIFKANTALPGSPEQNAVNCEIERNQSLASIVACASLVLLEHVANCRSGYHFLLLTVHIAVSLLEHPYKTNLTIIMWVTL